MARFVRPFVPRHQQIEIASEEMGMESASGTLKGEAVRVVTATFFPTLGTRSTVRQIAQYSGDLRDGRQRSSANLSSFILRAGSCPSACFLGE